MRTEAEKARHNECERARKTALRAAGKCVRCKVPTDRSECEECYRARKQFMLEYQRQRRAKLRSLGMCRDCIREKALEGKAWCAKCRDKHGARGKAWWSKHKKKNRDWQPERTVTVKVFKQTKKAVQTERIEKMLRLAARAGERLYA